LTDRQWFEGRDVSRWLSVRMPRVPARVMPSRWYVPPGNVHLALTAAVAAGTQTGLAAIDCSTFLAIRRPMA